MRTLIATALVLAVSPPAAQQPAPSFRAGIDIFTVEASVLDGSGKPVADLSPADFIVTVGGKPRAVRAARFHGSDGMGSIAPAGDTLLTAPVSNSGDDGRIVVFVVDRDSLAPGGERAILQSATSLLDGLRAGDASGVLELPGAATDLTRDHARVRAALMRITGSRPTMMQHWDYNLSWDEVLAYERRDAPTIARVVERECQPLKRAEGLRNVCPDDLKIAATEMFQTGRARTQTVLSNLSTLAAQLAPLRGTKQIVLLSSGFPFGQDLLPLYHQFTEQAAAAQIVFYAVHLDQPVTDVTARKTMTSAFGGAEFASGLGNAASMTGGAFFMASGSGAGVFQRVANEIHNFYELAIETDPGDFTARTLDVEVKVNRAGASVRNRRRVIAPSTNVTAGTDRVSEMLRQPVDVSEVAVALSVYTMRGDDASTLRTLVGLDAGGAGSVGPGEWGFAVFSDGNVVATGRQKLDKPAGPWTAAMSAKLLPGRYRLRAAVIDGANRAGVVERPLDVGLRGSPQLQFSDLLVGVADANGRLQPSSRVMKGAALSALVEVISADPAMLEKVRTVIEIVPGGSATPIKRFMMAAQTGSSAAILTNTVEIPTADLEAGRYSAIATPMIGEQAIGRVSRVFEITSRP
jgi:VWFA-related protein